MRLCPYLRQCLIICLEWLDKTGRSFHDSGFVDWSCNMRPPIDAAEVRNYITWLSWHSSVPTPLSDFILQSEQQNWVNVHPWPTQHSTKQVHLMVDLYLGGVSSYFGWVTSHSDWGLSLFPSATPAKCWESVSIAISLPSKPFPVYHSPIILPSNAVIWDIYITKTTKTKHRAHIKNVSTIFQGFFRKAGSYFGLVVGTQRGLARKSKRYGLDTTYVFHCHLENGERIYLWYDGTHLPDFALFYPEDHNRNQ
jgi:hypothetical protein